MTQEEKAKAYDKALEQAKKELNTCGSMNCDAARQIFRFFPELRESEDERIRTRLSEYFRGFLEGNEHRYEDGGYVKWEGLDVKSILTWLEKQKEQKPAEWSEEDVDMLNSCISSIEEAKENRYAYKETDGDTSYDHEIAWLKSLRPDSYKNCNSRWKPSEEQMEALHYVKQFDYGGHKAALVSLYEQLEKL